MNNVEISIAKDFSAVPAGRYEGDSEYHGTAFRENCLAPPLKKGDHVHVIFDGVAGFGSSFLDEAFGGLVRNEGLTKEFLADHLSLATSQPELEPFVRLARRYIQEA